MATWVVTSFTVTGSPTSDTDAQFVCVINESAPGDFDPAAVTAVSLTSLRATGSGFGNDQWHAGSAVSGDQAIELWSAIGSARLATDIATVANDQANADSANVQKQSISTAGTGGTISTTATTASWEAGRFVVQGTTTAPIWFEYDKVKGGDGTAITFDDASLTITYTPTATTISPVLAQQLVTAFDPTSVELQLKTIDPGLAQQLVTSFQPTVGIVAFGSILQQAKAPQEIGGTTHTATLASAPNEGELIVLQYGVEGTTANAGVPSGFSIIAETYDGVSGASGIALKVAGASEGTTYSITHDTGADAVLIATVREPGNGIEKWIVDATSDPVVDTDRRYAESVDTATGTAVPGLSTGTILEGSPDGSTRAALLAQIWLKTDAVSSVTWSGTASVVDENDDSNSATGDENQIFTAVEFDETYSKKQVIAQWTGSYDAILTAVTLVERDTSQTSPNDNFNDATNGKTPSGTRWSTQVVDPALLADEISDRIWVTFNVLRLSAGIGTSQYSALMLDESYSDTDYEVKFLITGNFIGTGNKWLYAVIGGDGTVMDGVLDEDGRPDNCYYVRVKITAGDTGSNDHLYKRIGGTETQMEAGLDSGTEWERNAAEPFYLGMKIENSGSNVVIGVKAWDQQSTEPTAYDEYTDTAPGVLADTLSVPGFVVRNFQASEDLQVWIDDFEMATLVSGLSITPGLVQQLVTSFAPTITTGAVDISPALATQLVTSFAPTVTTTVDIAPAIATQLTTSFAPTVTVGAVNLSPDLATQLITSFAPTVTTGAVDIAPAIAQQLITSFAPTVAAGAVDIAPALATQLVTAFDPTVAAGAVDIAPELATQLTTSFAPTVAVGAADISPDLAVQLVTTFAPTVYQEQFVSPALAQSLVASFAPALVVSGGTQDIAPEIATQLVTSFAPTLTTNVDLLPALATQLVVSFEPLVAIEQTASTPLATQLVTSFDPVVTVGAVDISPAIAQQPLVSFSPTVTTTVDISTDLVTQLVTSFDPVLTVGAVDIAPALASQLVTSFSPNVTQAGAPQEVTPALATQLVTSFEPTVAREQFASVPLAQSLVSAFSPVLTTSADISPALAQQLVTSYAPTLAQEQFVTTQLAQQLVTSFAPSVAVGATDIAPELVQQLTTSFAPTIVQESIVEPALAQQLITSFDPVVTTGAVDLSPDLAQQLVTAFAPTVELNDVFVTPDLVQQLVTSFDPVVVAGGALIEVDLKQQLIVAFAPTVGVPIAQISTDLAQQLIVAFDPTLTTGAVDVAPDLTQQLIVAFEPTLSVGAATLQPDLFQQLVSAFDPEVGMVVHLDLVTSLIQAFDPRVAGNVTKSTLVIGGSVGKKSFQGRKPYR